MDEMMQKMVESVRSDKMVGRGTCSSIDECYTDEELAETLRIHGATDEASAVKAALKLEGLFLEEGLNQRWGDDDDPQLLDYNRYREGLRERGIGDV